MQIRGNAPLLQWLLATSNCLNCHAGVPPTTTPALATVIGNGLGKGCLIPKGDHGQAPDFAFTAEQRDAVVAFLAHGLDSLKQEIRIGGEQAEWC